MSTAGSTPAVATALRQHPPQLVSAQWLHDRLGQPDLTVVEVDVSPSRFDEGHIDGAVLWNVYTDLKDADFRTVGVAALEALMARSGIGPDSTVVFYGYAPCLGLWLLTRYGCRQVHVLDCSREAWQAAGRPWGNDVGAVSSGSRLGREDMSVRADRTAVRAAIGRAETLIVDVRTEPEFLGERFWPSGAGQPDGRAGHVPSAIHQPIDDLYRPDGSFRSRDELLRVFSAVDVPGAGEVITYCTVGGRAATAWFVLRYLLGRNGVRVYDGSWAEWGRSPEVPVETGAASRST